MPPLPADGIFAVDALLVRPGAYVRDPVLWQWQDDKGNWHTYGYNDCRYSICHCLLFSPISFTTMFSPHFVNTYSKFLLVIQH